MTTLPAFIGLRDWADAMSIDLQSYGLVPRLDDDDWKDFGRRLLILTNLSTVPDPEGFEDWREWASRFVSAVP